MTVKVNNRQTLFQLGEVSWVNENITLPNDVTTDVYILRHPGVGAIVPMFDDNTVLLLKQYRHALGRYIWEIPAGTRDAGETPLACAQRELTEETGYTAEQWQKVGEITPVPGYADERIYIYLAENLSAARQHLDQEEIIDVHRIAFDKALRMIADGTIQDAKSICGLNMVHTLKRTGTI